ncbi:hypothetical protein RSAG8_07157, partial [Rhizoctonia solani AG-8 WAC10335]
MIYIDLTHIASKLQPVIYAYSHAFHRTRCHESDSSMLVLPRRD